MIIIAMVNFWLLIPMVIMVGLFYLMRYVFANTARDLKRIEALSKLAAIHSILTRFWFHFNFFEIKGRSPVYSHMNATMQGLSTVRAFHANKILEKEFHEFQDRNTSSLYLFLSASRWFALWTDIVCLLYISFVTYSFLVFGDGEYNEIRINKMIPAHR